MPHLISKQAAFRPKDMNSLVTGIADLAKKQGVKLTGTPEQTARRMMYGKHGTSSLTLDAGKWLTNKLPGKKKIGDAFGKKFSNMQRAITDFDIKAGEKAYTKLSDSKSKRVAGLRKAFINKHQLAVDGDVPGQARKILEIDVPGISAPLTKAKEVVVPVAGSMYIADKIYGDEGKKKQAEEGDGRMTKEEVYREELINKVAEALHQQDTGKNLPEKKSSTDDDAKYSLIKKASLALRASVQKQRELKEDNVKLAEENKRLYYEYEQFKKRQEVEKVAHTMHLKGVLRKSDIHSKVNELMAFEKEAFDLFKEAVDNLYIEDKTAGDEVDSLTFLAGSNNLNKGKTLAESLTET